MWTINTLQLHCYTVVLVNEPGEHTLHWCDFMSGANIPGTHGMQPVPATEPEDPMKEIIITWHSLHKLQERHIAYRQKFLTDKGDKPASDYCPCKCLRYNKLNIRPKIIHCKFVIHGSLLHDQMTHTMFITRYQANHTCATWVTHALLRGICKVTRVA